MSWIEKSWYQQTFLSQLTKVLLLPLTGLFWLLSTLRRFAYKSGLKSQTKISVPVIVVGNISVGGNGKTPTVVRLAQWLRQAGYHPGVLSRGYGGSNKIFPLSVTQDSEAHIVGDEPMLMRQHLPCPLVIDPTRARGADFLVREHKCDVIICDDGLQHYAMARDIEIVVVDGERQFGNGWLLPSGPLRESKARLDEVDFVIKNGGQAHNGEFLMLLEPGQLVNVKYPNQTQSVNNIQKPVVAAAAIGNPQRFFDLLSNKHVKIKSALAFADHHSFKAGDLPEDTVIMTEKDAVKCKAFAHEDWWYLPVSAKLTDDFKSQLLTKLKSL